MKSVLHQAYRFARAAGMTPHGVGNIRHLPRFLRDRREFKRQGGVIANYFPVLNDYGESSGTAKGHYFHQDLLVSQFIHAASPANHVDVGSRVDGFVAHVAAFRPLDVLDIRPLENRAHPNINFVQADLMSPQSHLVQRYASVSSLHALEHFGLGRYTDKVSVEGYRDGFDAIVGLLAPGGTLYISFPIGERRVEFNAHRIFDPSDIQSWLGERLTLKRFDFIDDAGDLWKDQAITAATGLRYGCGIYTLTRAAA